MKKRNLPPVPPEIQALVPYKPGKPIEELERELGISGAIKLASNENPLGTSPKAQEAMAKALPGLNRYPDGAGFELRQALAKRYGLAQEQIVLGNGSNEIIELLCRAFFAPRRSGSGGLALIPHVLQAGSGGRGPSQGGAAQGLLFGPHHPSPGHRAAHPPGVCKQPGQPGGHRLQQGGVQRVF